MYGAEGSWGADIEPTSPVKTWDAFRWRSGAQMQYLKTFALLSAEDFRNSFLTPRLSHPAKLTLSPMHEFELFRGGEYRKKLSGSKWSEAHAFLKQTLPGAEGGTGC